MKWLIGSLMLASLLVAGADDLSKAKAVFAEKDKALNAAYEAAKKDLPPELFAKLQEDQRGWMKYRDYVSDGQGGVDGQQSPARWEAAGEITESRIKWVQAWKTLSERKGWSGTYSDGRGGWLEIAEKDGKLSFSLEIVRGPSLHTGGLSGEIRVNGGTGWFETKAEGQDKPTWLTFLNSLDYPGSVRVIAENTGYYHGARGYFHGTYLWLGPLSAE